MKNPLVYYEIKKPLYFLLAGILVLTSVFIYTKEDDFSGIIIAANMIAVILLFIELRSNNRKK